MDREIQKLQKELAVKIAQKKSKIVNDGARKVLNNIDINKFISKDKINVTGIVNVIRTELNRVNSSVAKMK